MPDLSGAPAGAEQSSPPSPVQGLTVYDETAKEFGTVADVWPTGLVFLRPIGGGREWQAHRESIRPALTSELLAERVRQERKRRGASWPGL